MANDVYVQDGVVYPDEATAVVMRHPDIPEELKRVYITKPDDKEDTTSSTMPLGSTEKPAGALELQPGTGVAPTEITSPEPSQGLDMTSRYNTELTPVEQADYNKKFSPGDSYDYDMQGYYKANPNVEPNTPGQHYPDTYKKPNHPTFSDESKYHGTEDLQGGTWGREGDKDTFTPGPTNLENHGVKRLQEYFNRTEPDVKLNIPDVIPEPYGLNPPERGPGFEGPPRGEPKVLFKTSTGVEFTDHDIENAINIASSFGTGTMAGVKSVKNMNKLSELGHAQVLESAGEHPDVVHKETGFFRGADSRWRYEIDDSKSVFDKGFINGLPPDSGGIVKLSEVLDHPDLYKAYPHLKDVQVKYDPDYKGIASWNNSNTVTMGPRAFTSNNPHSILMHEIQHAIQSEEGFAKGGAAGKSGTDFELKHSKAVRDLIPEMKELRNKAEAGTTTPAEDARLAWFHEIAETYSKYAEAGDVKAFENYLKLAGETESRNVEARLFMSEEARRRVPPRKTEDYTPREQIIRSVPEMTTAYTRQYK